MLRAARGRNTLSGLRTQSRVDISPGLLKMHFFALNNSSPLNPHLEALLRHEPAVIDSPVATLGWIEKLKLHTVISEIRPSAFAMQRLPHMSSAM
jgi:hypothetical protein